MKTLLIALLSLFTLTAAYADEAISVTLTAGQFYTNILSATSGSIKVTGVTISSGTPALTNIMFLDTALTYTKTNAAYTVTNTYATNIVTFYTNYFGVSNYITNVALAQLPLTVIAATNAVPATFAMSSPVAGQTVTIQDLNFVFHNGLSITNASLGVGTVIIQYRR